MTIIYVVQTAEDESDSGVYETIGPTYFSSLGGAIAFLKKKALEYRTEPHIEDKVQRDGSLLLWWLQPAGYGEDGFHYVKIKKAELHK